jgi:hypothetical protein
MDRSREPGAVIPLSSAASGAGAGAEFFCSFDTSPANVLAQVGRL